MSSGGRSTPHIIIKKWNWVVFPTCLVWIILETHNSMYFTPHSRHDFLLFVIPLMISEPTIFLSCLLTSLLTVCRFGPSGSSVFCSREGHLQTRTRGGHEAGWRGEGCSFVQPSHLHELSLLSVAGRLQPLPHRILHCCDIKSHSYCAQGEYTTSSKIEICNQLTNY